MFLSHYEHTIDEKGRLTIPAKFRELLGDGAYITKGIDQNLFVLTEPVFEQMYARLDQMNITDPSARMLKRLFLSNANKVESDKAGRILIPSFLREAARLQDSAVVVGMGSYFEIWEPGLWAEQEKQQNNLDTNNDRFAGLNLSVG